MIYASYRRPTVVITVVPVAATFFDGFFFGVVGLSVDVVGCWGWSVAVRRIGDVGLVWDPGHDCMGS